MLIQICCAESEGFVVYQSVQSLEGAQPHQVSVRKMYTWRHPHTEHEPFSSWTLPCPPISTERQMSFQFICCTQTCSSGTALLTPVVPVLIRLYNLNYSVTDKAQEVLCSTASLSHPCRTASKIWSFPALEPLLPWLNPQQSIKALLRLICPPWCHCSTSLGGWGAADQTTPAIASHRVLRRQQSKTTQQVQAQINQRPKIAFLCFTTWQMSPVISYRVNTACGM